MSSLVLLSTGQVSLQLGCSSTTAAPSGGVIGATPGASVGARDATAAVEGATANALAVVLLRLASGVLTTGQVAAHIACGQSCALVAASVVVAACACCTNTPGATAQGSTVATASAIVATAATAVVATAAGGSARVVLVALVLSQAAHTSSCKSTGERVRAWRDLEG